MQRAAALIFATSSHSFSWCQKHCESVSHSYAATDGPIPLLQLSRRRDSWGPVSRFRASFIFLLANDTEALLEKKTSRRQRPPASPDPPRDKKDEFAGPETGRALKLKVYVPSIHAHADMFSHYMTNARLDCLLVVFPPWLPHDQNRRA